MSQSIRIIQIRADAHERSKHGAAQSLRKRPVATGRLPRRRLPVGTEPEAANSTARRGAPLLLEPTQETRARTARRSRSEKKRSRRSASPPTVRVRVRVRVRV
ncbi:hypothetical protein DCS_00653 [Drechmeria coniospora]|uniref:Uncharacterized protein n=1 Tax=Drechmeria coniospora TaxID=98403 RepID=A0A151GR06_DRECN|nr:hypothetical protein DCS_00653 [Drechmeria coniospora]KYK59523.1 hypothetical protein DCS_00653 [Drechmeria coniospora]